MIKLRACIGIGVVVLGLFVHPAVPDIPEYPDVREAIVKVYTVHNVPDYYNPWSMRGTQQSTGSGAIIEGQRILTNGHVVRDHTFIQVRRHGESRRHQARVLFVSHAADLALLAVDDPEFFEGVEPLQFGELPETQDEVSVFGFPLGGDTLSITRGVISRIENQSYVHSSVNMLAGQIDAAINPGNSGGPVIQDSRIVGVVMQSLRQAENIGYMVPVPVIEHFMTDIETGKRDGIPSLGVVLQNMENPDMRRRYKMEEDQTGVLIIGVIPGSAADSHIKEEDVLLSVAGEPVADDATVEFRPKERTSISYYIQKRQLGDAVTVDILRDGDLLSLDIPLNQPMENDWLIPLDTYDVLPTYYIYGGMVFSPLSMNLLKSWGRNWVNSAPKAWVSKLQNNFVTEEKDEIVVMLRVLAADVNQGYHTETHWTIDKVDGEPIRNLREMIEIVERNAGNEFVEFENPVGRKLVLDRQKVKDTHQEILDLYRIPQDRSDDL